MEKEKSEFVNFKNEVRLSSSYYSQFEECLTIENLQSEIKKTGLELNKKKCYLIGLLDYVVQQSFTILEEYKGRYAFMPSLQKGLGDVMVTLAKFDTTLSDDNGVMIYITFIENPFSLNKIINRTDVEKGIIKEAQELWQKADGDFYGAIFNDFHEINERLKHEKNHYNLIKEMPYTFHYLEMGQMIDFMDGRGSVEYYNGKPFKLSDFVIDPSDLVVSKKTKKK